MKKIIILICFTSLNCISQISNSVKVSPYEIKVLKVTPEVITYINTLPNKEERVVAIDPECTQESFDAICKLNWIEKLTIGSLAPNKTLITNLKPITNLINLKELIIYCKINAMKNQPINADYFSKLTNLETLNLQENTIINSEKLEGLKNIKYLTLLNSGLKNIEFIKEMQKIRELNISGKSNAFKDLTPLDSCTNIESLILQENINITEKDLIVVSNLINLNLLYIAKCKSVKNLDFLSKCFRLKALDAKETEINNIDGLKMLKKLDYIDISNTKVTSLLPIKDKSKLEYLFIQNLTIADLSPLYGCSSLVNLNASQSVTEKQRNEIKDNMPSLNIIIAN